MPHSLCCRILLACGYLDWSFLFWCSAAPNIQRQMPNNLGSETNACHSTNLMRLRVDTQVLEGPNIGDIRSLLNILLAVDTQVLEGPDIGDIGSPSTCCWSNTDRCSVARVCSFV